MPNLIKYSTGSTPTTCIRKGDMLIGVGSADFGTSFYSGITPSNGGYTIYQNKVSGGPSIYCPASDDQLISMTNRDVAGTVASPASYTTAAQCLAYYAGNRDKICVNTDYEAIVTNGLVLNVDAGFTASYPRSGNRWYDISATAADGTLTNGPFYATANGGNLLLDGSNDYVTFGNQNLGLDGSDKTFCAWVKLGATLANPTAIIDKEFDNPGGSYGGWAFWVGSDRKLWWWNASNKDIRDTGSTTLGTNVWAHIAVVYTYSTKTAAFYINGSLNSSSSNSGISENSSSTQDLAIGAGRIGSASPLGYLNGNIGNVLAYNRALTAAAILQNYNAQRARYGL